MAANFQRIFCVFTKGGPITLLLFNSASTSDKMTSMSIFASIAERRITEAIQNGLLDDLSLKGKPIPHEDLSAVPEEMRMGYKVLKNAGYLPEELQLRQEILNLKDMVQACSDPEERAATKSKLTIRQLQFEMLMEKRGRSLAWGDYENKLQARLLK